MGCAGRGLGVRQSGILLSPYLHGSQDKRLGKFQPEERRSLGCLLLVVSTRALVSVDRANKSHGVLDFPTYLAGGRLRSSDSHRLAARRNIRECLGSLFHFVGGETEVRGVT